ncbi:hypothetical protein BCON_0163g00210 [Botryotinia convoluta]|uniref:Uncharacterized protein n=1 Tax=Botryotinia convoluta TaxID=54673 RepID=A0A4Z1HY23_9HELO|nr:hypothetical protein BCON_0163g00210 [Botryotinia convoluta]
MIESIGWETGLVGFKRREERNLKSHDLHSSVPVLRQSIVSREIGKIIREDPSLENDNIIIHWY